jgi:trimeric autotransporter adhesin
MSTKTTFKRIALVAVAALGLGVLSVAPSSAAVSAVVVTVANGTAGLAGAASDTSTGAQISVSGLLDEGTDSITVQFVQRAAFPAGAAVVTNLIFLETTTPNLASSTRVDNAIPFAGATSYSATESVTASGGYTVTGTTSGTATYVGAKFALFLDSSTAASTNRIAGTYSYTVIVKQFSRGVQAATATTSHNVDIVIAAAAADSKVVNAARSTAILNAGTATGATTDDSVAAVATAADTTHATVAVRLNNASGQPNGTESITATITGAGVLGTSGGSYGKSLLLASTGTTNILVRADGTAGKGTITISTPSVTFAPKVVTFYALTAKTIAASTNKPVIGAGTSTAVVYAKATDANGTPWGGAAYIYASTAADALIAGSATPVACTYVAADDVHACPVSGTTPGTAKFKVIDAATVAAATATSNEVSVRVSAGVPTTAKLAFDKATYAPGEKAQIWVTALDAAGLALAEQTVSNIFAAGGISSSTAFSSGSDTLTATFAALAGDTSASAGTVAGYRVYTVYMPMSSGVVTISATGGTGLAASGRVAISASAEVVNSSVDAATDAANEATDAANAATDAALAAADAADAATAAAQDASDAVAALSASVSKLISSLRAQITSLTNLVIKIQKKVRA